jgi:hypothetical protein
MAELGWTVEQVADCPLPDVWKITKHWKQKYRKEEDEPMEPRQAMKVLPGVRQATGKVPAAVKDFFRSQINAKRKR